MSTSDSGTAPPPSDPNAPPDGVQEQPQQVDQGGQPDTVQEQHDQQEDQGGQSDVQTEQHQDVSQGGSAATVQEQVQQVSSGGAATTVVEGAAAGVAGFAGVGATIAAAGMGASSVSAYIQCLDLPIPPIVFNFNPSAYKQVLQGKWSGDRLQPAGEGPPPQWLGVVPPEVTVPILLDAFSIPPVPPQATLMLLKQLLVPTPQSMILEEPTAPTVMFGWGPNIILEQAYVKKVEVNYERFLLGVPVRITATVTMQAVPLPAPLGATNPTSGGVATARTRTVVEGDTLQSIAFQEYKDPNKWRAIAEANRIDDPMRVKPGRVLIVPDRREAENLS
jgi:hypothetical protein